MKLSVKALALASGFIWGGAILFVGLINLARPSYGVIFLQCVSSVYPWYEAATGLGSVVTGTLDAFIDGSIAGALLAWLYNKLS